MSGEFQDFIDARAERDARLLFHVRDLCGKYETSEPLVAQALDLYRGRSSDPIIVPYETVIQAAAMSLSACGELSKATERTQPSLITRHPNFPWQPFKRIRDELMHPSFDILDEPQREKKLARIEKHFNALFKDADFSVFSPEEMQTSPTLQRLYDSFREFRALDRLTDGYAEGRPIPLTGTPAVKMAEREISPSLYGLEIASLHLPIAVTQLAQRYRLNEINSALGNLSLFAQEGRVPAIRRTEKQWLEKFRNHSAHFNDRIRSGKVLSEGDFETAGKLVRNVESSIRLLVTHDSPGFQEHFPHLAAKTTEDAADNLFFLYQHNTLWPMDPANGFAITKPSAEQLALMDRALAIIQAQTNTMNYRRDYVEDTFLFGMANIVLKCPAVQVHALLDFMETSGAAITDPEKLKALKATCPPQAQHSLNRFLADYTQLQTPNMPSIKSVLF